MTNPIDLSMKAATLWFRAATLPLRAAAIPLEVSGRIAQAFADRMLPHAQGGRHEAVPTGVAPVSPLGDVQTSTAEAAPSAPPTDAAPTDAPTPRAVRTTRTTRTTRATRASGTSRASGATRTTRADGTTRRAGATRTTRSASPEPVPSPKQRRRTARNEPTPGQAARRREALREAEADPPGDTTPGPGAEVQVAEPWEGYAAMPVADVLARLADADATTRAAVRLYEQAHDAREAVLHATEA